MKRILISLLAISLSMPLWAQNSKKHKVAKDSTSTTEQSDETTVKSKKKNKKKDTDTEDQADEKTTRNKKNTKGKSKKTDEDADMPAPPKRPAPKKPVPGQHTPQQHMVNGKKSKEPAPPAITVVNYYDQLPLEFLPQVAAYKDYKASLNSRLKVKDDAQFRESMIRTKNLEKGYLDLFTPGNDNLITRVQLFQTKQIGNKPPKLIMVVEQSDCKPECTNEIHIYRKDTTWKDVTKELMPKIDYKYAYNKIREKYKQQYLDYDLFDAKNYKDDATLKKAIVFNLVPGEEKIVVKEQYLPVELYTIKFEPNAPKGKFAATKSGN